jgi:flagellar biosynthesis chaperone FliJ
LRQKRKCNAYDTLSKRHQKGELLLEARLEQCEQDEYARKLFAAKRAHDEGG